MLPADSEIRTRPARWFLKTVAIGLLSGGITSLFWARGRHLVRDMSINALVGWIFTLVMWAGFEVAGAWLKPRGDRPPEREALMVQARWLTVYAALLAVCVGLIRLLLGFSILHPLSTFLIAALVGLLISSVLLGQYSLVDTLKAQAALSRAEARAQALALQAQLSPHTLFNALNAIAALIPEDPRSAEEATERLSKLLRRILSALERESWSLGEEFQLLEDLLRLEALRFGPRLGFALELPEAEAGRPVPPLLILPLVENSLKHGFRPKVGPCHLTVTATAGTIRVADDGVGRDPSAPEGVGLRTVRRRLEAAGGHLEWEAPPVGCAVTLELPCA